MRFVLFFYCSERKEVISLQIITNNPLVVKKFEGRCRVVYYDVSFRDLLVRVRDMIHLGYELLSHPLSGSVKPNETPYKSILVSDKPGKLNPESVKLIEESIITTDKFPIKFPQMPKDIRDDFQLIDCTLIQSVFQ